MQAEHRDEAKEGLERDVLENREALGLVPAGQEEEGEEGEEEEEAVPPQVLKERIESVIEVLSEFQVRPVVPSESALVLLPIPMETASEEGSTMRLYDIHVEEPVLRVCLWRASGLLLSLFLSLSLFSGQPTHSLLLHRESV